MMAACFFISSRAVSYTHLDVYKIQVKEQCGESFLTVTPGIRFADSTVGDQKRIMTPEKAGRSGCDYIVVGRPITQAADPVAAYRRAVTDFLG